MGGDLSMKDLKDLKDLRAKSLSDEFSGGLDGVQWAQRPPEPKYCKHCGHQLHFDNSTNNPIIAYDEQTGAPIRVNMKKVCINLDCPAKNRGNQGI